MKVFDCCMATIGCVILRIIRAGVKNMFDDFDVTLGDIIRGERATQAKSITDVRLELRLSKSYIIAIEDGDLSVFRTPKFIASYVRSYAKYLGLDPEKSFDLFCSETGFKNNDENNLSVRVPTSGYVKAMLGHIAIEFSWPVRLRFI